MSRGGIILGALGGASDAILRGMDADRDQANAEARMRLASSLELEKAQAIEAIKTAPLTRLQSRAQALANQEVPQEAPATTALSGVYATDAGPSNAGFVGDIRSIKSAIDALPEGNDKQAAIEQLRQQISQQQAIDAGSVQGKTRKRTSDEAFEAALDEAKTSDLPAYMMGKALVNEKTITIPDGATVIDRSGKVLFSGSETKAQREREREDRRDARLAIQEEARDVRQQRYLEARDRLADARANNTLSREERLRYTSLFNDTGQRLKDAQKSLSTLRKSALYSIAEPGSREYQELQELQSQIKAYQEERSLYGRLLSSGASDGSVPGGQNDAAMTQPAPAQPRPPLSAFQK